MCALDSIHMPAIVLPWTQSAAVETTSGDSAIRLASLQQPACTSWCLPFCCALSTYPWASCANNTFSPCLDQQVLQSPLSSAGHCSEANSGQQRHWVSCHCSISFALHQSLTCCVGAIAVPTRQALSLCSTSPAVNAYATSLSWHPRLHLQLASAVCRPLLRHQHQAKRGSGWLV